MRGLLSETTAAMCLGDCRQEQSPYAIPDAELTVRGPISLSRTQPSSASGGPWTIREKLQEGVERLPEGGLVFVMACRTHGSLRTGKIKESEPALQGMIKSKTLPIKKDGKRTDNRGVAPGAAGRG